MARRAFLGHLAGLPFLAFGAKPQDPRKPLNIMMKGAWGPDDPTRAAFPVLHGLALAEAGHTVQIYLLSDATSLMRKSTVNAIFPVGWPPLSETLAKVVAKRISPSRHLRPPHEPCILSRGKKVASTRNAAKTILEGRTRTNESA